MHEALAAADALAAEGIRSASSTCTRSSPSTRTLRPAAEDTGGRRDRRGPLHEGGIGDAVLDALASEGLPLRLTKLAVREMAGSGKPEELLAWARIDAPAIADAVRALAKG